jgi:hypothetical protein
VVVFENAVLMKSGTCRVRACLLACCVPALLCSDMPEPSSACSTVCSVLSTLCNCNWCFPVGWHFHERREGKQISHFRNFPLDRGSRQNCFPTRAPPRLLAKMRKSENTLIRAAPQRTKKIVKIGFANWAANNRGLKGNLKQYTRVQLVLRLYVAPYG